MLVNHDLKSKISSPALVFDEAALRDNLEFISSLCKKLKLNLLFPLKSMTQESLIKIIGEYTQGFAASSLNEARFASSYMHKTQSVHFTSPGLLGEDIEELKKYCNEFSCNSLNQLKKLAQSGVTPLGVRLNPQLSFVKDERYDPCSRHSRLGIPIEQLLEVIEDEPVLSNLISGIHIHNNSESETFRPLYLTVKKVIDSFKDILPQLKWINLGGGYLFEERQDYEYLQKSVAYIRKYSHAAIFIEPGTAVTSNSGFLIASVIDLTHNRGKQIAVLDTTVNHMPEVLEFGYSPDIQEEDKEGKFDYILAGSTCLAGDVFGEYGFSEELKIGDKITLCNAGAYTLVKSHMFNGLNLPNLYLAKGKTKLNELKLLRSYNYDDFLKKYGDSSCSLPKKSL